MTEIEAIKELADSLVDAVEHPERYGTDGPKLMADRIKVLAMQLAAKRQMVGA